MADFTVISPWLLYQEDDRRIPGKIVDLGDGAGLTRLGITSSNYGNVVPPEFFSTMAFKEAVAVAKTVYDKYYWQIFQGDKIESDYVAAPLLSAAVNIAGGTRRAVKLLQHVLGAIEDGVLGPNTLAELNSKDPQVVSLQFRIYWADFYRTLVSVNPAKQKWLDGWIARSQFPYPGQIGTLYL